jgi:hypothetical protein
VVKEVGVWSTPLASKLMVFGVCTPVTGSISGGKPPSRLVYTSQMLDWAVFTKYIDWVCGLPRESYTVWEVVLV